MDRESGCFCYGIEKDSNLEASMDMAVWLDKYKVTGQDMSLSKWMINRMDHVFSWPSVMRRKDRTDCRRS